MNAFSPHLTQLLVGDDPDPDETAEWRAAFVSLAHAHGAGRARWMLNVLIRLAPQQRIGRQPELCTPYVNTMPSTPSRPFPATSPWKSGWPP